MDKFDIRVSLLHLLGGNLEIVALDFHGVDLLLEETADGENNFTFDNSGEAGDLKHTSGRRLRADSVV